MPRCRPFDMTFGWLHLLWCLLDAPRVRRQSLDVNVFLDLLSEPCRVLLADDRDINAQPCNYNKPAVGTLESKARDFLKLIGMGRTTTAVEG